MLLHILANVGYLNLGLNTDFGKYFGITDAGQLENLEINKPSSMDL